MLRCSVGPAGAAGPFTRPAAKGYYVQPHFVDEHGVSHPPAADSGPEPGAVPLSAWLRPGPGHRRASSTCRRAGSTSPQHNPKPQKPRARTCELRFRPSTSWRRTWTAWHPRRRALKRIFDALFVYNQLVFRTAPAEPIGSILGSCCLLLRVVLVPTWSP